MAGSMLLTARTTASRCSMETVSSRPSGRTCIVRAGFACHMGTNRCSMSARSARRPRMSRDIPNLGPRVSIVDHQGKLIGRFGETPAGIELGKFLAPHGLAVDSRGDVYVGEVSWTAWPQIYPDTLAARPHPLAAEVRKGGLRAEASLRETTMRAVWYDRQGAADESPGLRRTAHAQRRPRRGAGEAGGFRRQSVGHLSTAWPAHYGIPKGHHQQRRCRGHRSGRPWSGSTPARQAGMALQWAA